MRRLVYGLLRDEGGRFLVLQRPPHKRYASCWGFPGGKVDPGESDVEALVRECREEISVPVRVGRAVGSYVEPDGVFFVFEIVSLGGVITLNHEHVSYRWVSLGELAALPLVPFLAALLAQGLLSPVLERAESS